MKCRRHSRSVLVHDDYLEKEEGQGSWDSCRLRFWSFTETGHGNVLSGILILLVDGDCLPLFHSLHCKRSFLCPKQRIASQCLVCWREILMDDNEGMFDMSRQHQLKVCTVNVLQEYMQIQKQLAEMGFMPSWFMSRNGDMLWRKQWRWWSCFGLEKGKRR